MSVSGNETNPHPNMPKLIVAMHSMSLAMAMPPPSSIPSFLDSLLLDPDGREFWLCYCEGIITDRELRDVTMAHCATMISSTNSTEEPDSTSYGSTELEDEFSIALFDRVELRPEVTVF